MVEPWGVNSTHGSEADACAGGEDVYLTRTERERIDLGGATSVADESCESISAQVTAEGPLILAEDDPFRWGIRGSLDAPA